MAFEKLTLAYLDTSVPFPSNKMALRVKTATIKAIRLEDKKTWPVDLEVWVEISLRHPHKGWEAPFYLSHIQVKAFQKFMRDELKKKNKKRTMSH